MRSHIFSCVLLSSTFVFLYGLSSRGGYFGINSNIWVIYCVHRNSRWNEGYCLNISPLHVCFTCLVPRWFHGSFWNQLFFPVVWDQWVHDDRNAVPLQWPHHLSVEFSRCHYCGAVSYRQKVCADTLLLISDTMYQKKQQIEIILYEPYRGRDGLRGPKE